MKLRKDESYGIVYGHPVIAYEQNGRQFGPDLQAIDWDTIKVAEDAEAVKDLEAAQASIDKVKISRSEAIKAGLARRREQQGA